MDRKNNLIDSYRALRWKRWIFLKFILISHSYILLCFFNLIIFYNCYRTTMTTQLVQSFRQIQEEIPKEPVIKNKFFTNFILYSISYLIYGQVFTCLGPMFPYLSAVEGRVETQYSFLYTCRALGYMSGSLLIKMLEQKLTLHQIISLGVGKMGVFGILFSFFGGIWLKGFCIFISSIGGAFQDIGINIAVLQCFAHSNSAMWLQLIHGIFGIGGLTGPFAVYFFELQTLSILGFTSLCAIIFYFYLPNPQNQQAQLQQNEEDFKKFRHIPTNSLMLISSTFFFTLGQQTSYGGWISSYAVLNHFSSKQHATLYSSLYWISITVFRFVFAFVPGSPSKKIQYLGLIGVVNSVSGYYIIFYVNPEFGLNMMSFIFGFSNSALFPLLLTIPEEYGFKFTMQETATFITWSALGEGCLAVGIGKMMGLISYNWLIYGMLVMDLIIAVLCRANQLEMIYQKQRLDKDINARLMEGFQLKEINSCYS